ncbi:hypothetical protein FB451DRAFT_1137626 [Mycena latifolia]|nr:hypothetical protein FB451DRAFT_1137626 [Mycena latifolia]
MDPITATTTIITLATFIKDLIDVGQSIKQSIEKVGENRRRIRDLTDDILRTLDELANLARGHEDQFQAPALLSALGNLKADMLHVLSICLEISPPHPSGLRGFRSHIKVWIKRDDIEARIKHLKAHVNKCYLQFTAFSAARIEQTTARIEGASLHAANTTLRVEQKLIVNNVENQIHLRRLEGMMTRVLLETQFGQTIMDQTIEIIESDTTHRSLEFQYLSTEVSRLIVSLQQLAVKSVLILDEPLWASTNMVVMKTPSPKHILFDILWMSLQINESPAEIPFTSLNGIFDLGSHLGQLGMTSEATSWHLMAIQILRCFSGQGFQDSGVFARLALLSGNLSHQYQIQSRWDLAVKTSQQAIELSGLWQESSPDADHWPLLAGILITHSRNLREIGRPEDAISVAEEAVSVCREIARPLIESDAKLLFLTPQEEYKVVRLSGAYFALGQLEDALTDAERAVAACRKDVDAATMKYQKHALVHSLTVLSNCLAVVGRNDEALVAVEEATFMYTSSAPHMWGSFLYSLRREELGANAFHSLSLRLAASGQMEESLLNAEKATDLYRELVLLAPRHLPTLATSLQNLASRLCSAGRLNESVSACEEAVDILRKVADTEFYFLGALAEALDQLSKCLVEKGEAQRTAAATAESAEVRRRIALLPPQATFLFSEIEKDDDDKASEGISTQEDAPPTYTASQVVGEEVTTEQTKTEVAEKTTKPAKPHLAILNTPLELKLSSTPLDLLWWLLVGILGAGLAVLWSRGR